jgi:hypothetical protein
MGTYFIIDGAGAASGATKKRHDSHFSTVDVAQRKRLVYKSKRKHCLYRHPADLSYEKIDEISRPLRLMQDGISFDKIIPKQMGYFRTRIN